ncbi:IclR family transcriptional regulator [Pseudarthrobacter phenanthrenivorans]|uniref:IclR family transcriptional regulator n=1 Tax=Pseudarthrobacter phenanthrenivorans TaxID=361575 RepID=UPI00344CF4F0
MKQSTVLNESTPAAAKPEPGVQSVLKSLRVLEAVAQHQPVRVGELAPMLKMSKSTVQRCLRTLGQAGWLTEVGGDLTRWVLSNHARFVLSSSSSEIELREAALPAMRELRDGTGETVHLSVPAPQHTMVVIERAESRHELRTAVPIGSAYPDIATAGGIALLALRGAGEISEAIARAGSPIEGHETLTPEGVQANIETARRKGYSVQVSASGHTIGVGAAILDESGVPVAAIALLVPISRHTKPDTQRLGAAVVAAATKASQALETSRGLP